MPARGTLHVLPQTAKLISGFKGFIHTPADVEAANRILAASIKIAGPQAKWGVIEHGLPDVKHIVHSLDDLEKVSLLLARIAVDSQYLQTYTFHDCSRNFFTDSVSRYKDSSSERYTFYFEGYPPGVNPIHSIDDLKVMAQIARELKWKTSNFLQMILSKEQFEPLFESLKKMDLESGKKKIFNCYYDLRFLDDDFEGASKCFQ